MGTIHRHSSRWLYGTRGIPTLLGNDNNNGNTSGNYYNDHPMGPQATLGRSALPTTNAVRPVRLHLAWRSKRSISRSSDCQHDLCDFADHYGYPASLVGPALGRGSA